MPPTAKKKLITTRYSAYGRPTRSNWNLWRALDQLRLRASKPEKPLLTIVLNPGPPIGPPVCPLYAIFFGNSHSKKAISPPAAQRGRLQFAKHGTSALVFGAQLCGTYPGH